MVQTQPHSALFDYFEAPHILVMDADTSQSLQLKDYLERQGFRITLSYNEDDAHRLVYETRPDLLILDLKTPDGASLEFCQAVKSDHALGFLPVIMMTNSPAEHEWLSGILAGADEYLAKPLIFKELLLRVQALMWIKRQFDKLISQNTVLEGDLAIRNEELREALEVANQVRLLQRHFIHNVNHEFRTPLLQIKSSMSMLRDLLKKEPTINPQAHTLADMAVQATARLNNIVDNIAQFELFETCKREPMVLSHSINSAVKQLQRNWAYQEDIERVETFLGVELPPVLGDQRAVTRILVNLVENALKFSRKNVEISVRLLKDEDRAWVAVKDYGIGIPPEKQDVIFDPFVQLDPSSTREYNGLGVGLTIAQMLAKNMGTRIQVSSVVGDHSLFSFKLPLLHLQADKDSD